MQGDVSEQTLHREEGRRRIDRVLAPSFARDLQGLDMAELRHRRDEALAEREYLSLLRRLVHGRLDIVRAESARRAEGGGGPATSLTERLTAILSSEDDRGPSRGEALRVPVPDEEVAKARRRIERLVSDASISDPGLSDDDLVRAATRLEEEERMVSKARTAVLEVHDRLQEELKRRFKEDLSQITTS